MVSGRHRNSRPSSTRRVPAPHPRTQFKPKVSSYSHINIQPATQDDAQDLESDNVPVEDFVRHKSLQVEIEEGLAFAGKSARSSKSPKRPRTFAEAAMSTRRRGRRNSAMDGSSDATLSGPMSLESLGPFKYTFKKKKKISKWSPLDLSAADSASEVGSISASDVGSSRAASPNPQSSILSQEFDNPISTSNTTTQSSTTSRNFDNPIPNTTPGKGIGIQETDLDFPTDADPTPTQPRFEPFYTTAIENEFDGGNSLDFIDCNASDSQSTKDRTEAAMAAMAHAFGGKRAGEDAFDALEWDPDLPAVSSPDKSPEPITVKPQPVAYTTVGSVVNPNAIPQITAPNRIQREGANRRPLMIPVQSRHYDTYVQPRGPPPPLSMQNSMQYTQQLGQSPIHYNHTPPSLSGRSSHFARSNQQFPTGSMHLNEQEKQILTRQGMNIPQIFSGNAMTSPVTPTPVNNQFSGSGGNVRQVFSVKELMEEEEMGRSNSVQGPVQGLEKMQTLQRLAKFNNPMQELARSRLSEFSVVQSRTTGKTLANPTGTSPFEALLHNRKTAMTQKIDTNFNKTEELDRGYQFPPPGLASSSASQANPLYGAYSSSTSQSSAQSRPPGYPQPLTAGPPGQRQYPGGPNKIYNHFEALWATEGRSPIYNSFGNPEATSPWSITCANTTQPAATQPAVATQYETPDYTKPFDTLSPADVAKYYPFGFPSDMTGKYTPLPYEIQERMDQIPHDGSPEVKKAKKEKELNDWLYSGQRRYAMSAEDHMTELEERLRTANPFGTIGPPSKKVPPPVKKDPLSIDDLKKMSTAEAAAPLLDGVFGTLLAYADKSSGSRRVLSKFVQSPEWQIDDSEKGNVSFFGEDWGPPPKRTGRDPRYQPTFHNPGSPHGEH